MNRFTRDSLPGRVIFGEGALETELGSEIRRLDADRPLLISNASAELNELISSLSPAWAGHWSDVRQHVPVDLADECHRAAVEYQADLLVAVGGGSATGLAKAVAHRSGLKILCVPTTYAGSEMTPIWGQSDGQVKRTARDNTVLPATVLYDPALLSGLPSQVVAASGMNALAHCVEALYAPNADPLSSLMAVEGARLLFEHLPAALDASASPARGEILWASCLAGSVLGTAGGSLHHSICHLLGGLHDLPHAETHAVVLPHVLSYLVKSVAPQLQPLAVRLEVSVAELPGKIWDLGSAVGTPTGLAEIGIGRQDIEGIVNALIDKAPASPAPLPRERATKLIRHLVDGDRPATPVGQSEYDALAATDNGRSHDVFQ